jgi:hypothetical protein
MVAVGASAAAMVVRYCSYCIIVLGTLLNLPARLGGKLSQIIKFDPSSHLSSPTDHA